GAAEPQDPSDPQVAIREILAHEDFERFETRRTLGADGELEASPAGFEVFAFLLTVVAWTLAIAVVVALLVIVVRALGWIEWKRAAKPQAPEPPTHLFGLDLRPQSL